MSQLKISKIIGYAITGNYPEGISISKLNTYTLISDSPPLSEVQSSIIWLITSLRTEKTMAIYGVEQVVHYIAWDTENNAMKTGDVANHTIYWVKDGTAAAAANSPAEVDAVNTPGLYKLTVTAAEAQCLKGFVAGKSSTENIVIFGSPESFVRLPNVAPGANGGLPTTDANNRIVGIQGTKNTLDDLNDLAVDDIPTGGEGEDVFIHLTSLDRIINVNEINSVKDISEDTIQILLTSNKLLIVTDPTDVETVRALFEE